MNDLEKFHQELFESYNFVNSVKENPSAREISNAKPEASPSDEFLSKEMENLSVFERALAKQSKNFVPLNTFIPSRQEEKKPTDNGFKVPDEEDFARALTQDIQKLRKCEKRVRNGEIPLTDKLRRKFNTACINIPPANESSSSSSSSLTYYVEMSEELQRYLDNQCYDDDSVIN